VGKEFGTVMKKVFEHLETLDFDEKTINSIGRVVHIWEERGIFDKRIQAKRGLKRKKSALSSLLGLCFAPVFFKFPTYSTWYFSKIQARARNKNV
jgi:hypothetical protein